VNDFQRLFLSQARADWALFVHLRAQEGMPVCHILHSLQMATEMFGKAFAWRSPPQPKTHRALVRFLRGLMHDRRAREVLGYSRRTAGWRQLIRKALSVATEIEQLAPANAGDGPNPEYPWPPNAPRQAPVAHDFQLWKDLHETAIGRQLLTMLDHLFVHADEFF
jgi:hypothetical protein